MNNSTKSKVIKTLILAGVIAFIVLNLSIFIIAVYFIIFPFLVWLFTKKFNRRDRLILLFMSLAVILGATFFGDIAGLRFTCSPDFIIGVSPNNFKNLFELQQLQCSFSNLTIAALVTLILYSIPAFIIAFIVIWIWKDGKHKRI